MDRNCVVFSSGANADRSLSARRAWIEMLIYFIMYLLTASLSARRAWIEISISYYKKIHIVNVALRKESVDRNIQPSAVIVKMSVDRNNQIISTNKRFRSVALRKESVDRNTSIDNITQGVFVALRKESVDRNNLHVINAAVIAKSLSARRAWIEIRHT